MISISFTNIGGRIAIIKDPDIKRITGFNPTIFNWVNDIALITLNIAKGIIRLLL